MSRVYIEIIYWAMKSFKFEDPRSIVFECISIFLNEGEDGVVGSVAMWLFA